MNYPFTYWIELEDRTSYWVVSIPDFDDEDGITAESSSSLHEQAEKRLYRLLSTCFDQRKQVPLPSTVKGHQPFVSIPLRVAIKVLLHNAMIEQDLDLKSLAKRMGGSIQDAHLLVDLEHPTPIDHLEAAFFAIDRQLHVSSGLSLPQPQIP